MKAEALTPRDLFQGLVQFEIPPFQRPYVWNEEDQWAPLWSDICRVAEAIIRDGGGPSALERVGAHFLGAVVVKERSHYAGDVSRSAVIDGQQRMTTLQILLDAAHAAAVKLGYDDEAEFLQKLILNDAKKFEGTKDRFKLWPSRTDRLAFESVLDGARVPVREARISQAHHFFSSEADKWIAGDEQGSTAPGTEQERAQALSAVLQSGLYLVAINLGPFDDDQLIFETLNDRGTPLLAADLIKNWVFQRGEAAGADTESWADEVWAEFDQNWWRERISQGRHFRSRIDIFLQYWLTMRAKEEIPTERVFRRFMEYASTRFDTPQTADDLLGQLRKDADTFRSFAQLESHTAPGRFYWRVIEAFEQAATTPVLLWMLSENSKVPEEQVAVGLAALESWVLRRTLLGRTMKDVNKFMVALLGVLDGARPDEAGEALWLHLTEQTADARTWPTDEEVMSDLPMARLYGNIRQSRLRVVLGTIEQELRDERHESTELPAKLEVEHIMPRGWAHHWNEVPPLDAERSANRAHLVDRLGNLTLVTDSLNKSLSHRPWTDEAAKLVAPTGKFAGRGKRWLLNRYSLLVLNKLIVEEHVDAWTESDIQARGHDLATHFCAVWRR